ncbi:3-oxoacyl-reductase [Xylogone sp. PMI_703]|nr:3-oxoacyl-reductase [Xylogone sp. PMI_703]
MSLSNAAWDDMIKINLSGVFYAMRAQVQAMVKNERDAKGNTGSIVNISSLGGIRGFPGASHYAAAKWGIIGLTNSVAKEMGAHGIRANSVCPGVINTAMLEGTVGELAEGLRMAAETNALKRMATPDECAGIIALLLSDKASYITGSTQVVDGGSSS